MNSRQELRYTVSDQFGSRAVVEKSELDRVVGNWGMQKLLADCYDSEPYQECPACDTKLAEAVATGLMGCPACYTFVYPQYQAAIRSKGLDSNLSQQSPDPNQVS